MKLSDIPEEIFCIGKCESIKDKVFYETIDEARIAAEELCRIFGDYPAKPVEVYSVTVKFYISKKGKVSYEISEGKIVIKYTPSTTWRKEISF